MTLSRPPALLPGRAVRLIGPGLALALAFGAPAAAAPGDADHCGHHDMPRHAMPMHGHGDGQRGPEARGHHMGKRGHRAEAAAERARVAVTGEGQAAIAPDIAVVRLGVMVQAPTAAEAMAENAARQQGVFRVLAAAGLDPRDVQTSDLALNAIQDYSRENGPPVITGYQASNIVTLRMRDLAELGPVIDGVIEAGANEIQGITFEREDASAVEIRARERAVENARERAEAMAGAAGHRLGRLVTLSDIAVPDFGPRPEMMRAMAADAASTPIAAGELRVEARVNATWELVPAGDRNCGHDRMDEGDHDRMGPGDPPRPVGPVDDEGVEGDSGERPVPLADDPAEEAAADRPAVVTGETPEGEATTGEAPLIAPPMSGLPRQPAVPDWLDAPDPTPPRP